jgi:Mn2+/Fe2+ NRAMP family transporter
MLVAATGVGAGDLAAAGLAGSQLGVAVLWAVLIGAFLKFVQTEGLARWQLATGTTVLEGTIALLGRPAIAIFMPYLIFWSFFVGAALMGACGVTLYAIFPVFDDPSTAKVVFGILQALIGLALVLIGGFKLFERVMGLCIGVMFITVAATAVALWPGWSEVMSGLCIPAAETLEGTGLTWTVALMGGVGGTVTVLCYGYWIREKGRVSVSDITACRIDLGAGYLMTAIFGIAMVIIASRVRVEGRGAGFIVQLAETLEEPLGAPGKWAFLAGAWGAVFSSLLGVLQAVPLIFADLCRQIARRGMSTRETERLPPLERSRTYRCFLLALAFVPMLGLMVSFKEAQKIYAVIGACFLPILALALLILNRARHMPSKEHANKPITVAILVATMAFFSWILWSKF